MCGHVVNCKRKCLVWLILHFFVHIETGLFSRTRRFCKEYFDGAGGNARLKSQHSELKAELKIKEAQITALRFRVESAVHEKTLAVSKAALKGQLNVSQLTEDAYEKGFSRAMKNFKDAKALISDA
eukprot:6179775-Pleurochrysis_carterae.AAC.1